MSQLRQDAWSDESDLTLAQTVLKHIRTGSTQLAAFEEVAKVLNRTSAACGFRWNSDVRKKYDTEIQEAKILRSSNKGKLRSTNRLASVSSVSVAVLDPQLEADYTDQIITAARNLKSQNANLVARIKGLTEELREAREHIATLEEQLHSQNPEKVVTEDYNALMQILERARKIGALSQISG